MCLLSGMTSLLYFRLKIDKNKFSVEQNDFDVEISAQLEKKKVTKRLHMRKIGDWIGLRSTKPTIAI